MLKISDLVVHYGGAICLKEVSLEVGEGEIVSLIGNNGAGKTTIVRTITGLKKATSGRITFKDLPIDTLSTQAIIKAGIAHVLQGRNLFQDMTVWENLKVGAYLQKDKTELNRSFERIFSSFPILKDRTNQQARTLSGGEQQMLAIARALVIKPRLLLLDEPTIGLAPLMVKEIGKIIKEINDNGTSVLLIEQNSRLALRLGRRAYVMETGKIVLQGTGEELLRDERIKKAYLGQ